MTTTSGGWANLPLRRLCTVVSGATPRRDVPDYWATNGSGIPWVTPKDLSDLDGKILEDTPEYITEEGFRSCSTAMLPERSLLLSSRAPIGLLAVTGRAMCTNQGFKSLVPHADVSVDYLYYALLKNIESLQDKGHGATFKEVNKAIVEEFEVSVPTKNGKPDLAEQKRIAAILDKADAIRRKRQQALALTDDLLRSTFLDMFGDPLTNPKGWEVVTIGDLVEEVKYGSSKKAGAEGAWPMLRMNNITPAGGWDFSSLKYLDLDEDEIPKYTVTKGDLLFNRTNSKELVGKTAVYREEAPMAYAGYLIRLRTNEYADAEYISAYLNSAHGKTTLMGMCKAIIGMANINAQELRAIRILKPPIRLQREYAALVGACQTSRHTRQSCLTEASHLFDSCLQRAFRGDL